MMEKLGLPPWSMVSTSRVFSRYYSESETTRKYYNPLDKQTPLKFIPRYCTIHQNTDGSAELRPNLSKKTRRLRKPPGAVPVMQALVSTLSHSSGKYHDYTPTPAEELDNTHVVKLIEACLSWTPEKRITPEQAKNFSWFSYKAANTNGNRPISLLSLSSRSPNLSAASGKLSNASSQLSLHTETIPTHRSIISNVAPIVAPTVSSAAPDSIVQNTPPQGFPINNRIAQIKSKLPSNKTKILIADQSISPPSSRNSRRHGSPASISSGENKQEERIIYARVKKPSSPKATYFEYNGGTRNLTGPIEKKISDISLASRGSSIDDLAQLTLETSRYTRKNGVQVNERYIEPTVRSRKRNQSMEPKRHTQPVGNEVITKEKCTLPTQNLITSKTAAMSSSPEDESQRSGRCNPNSFSKYSQWDISAIGQRETKIPNPEPKSNAAKARQHITIRSELLTLDRRPQLAKTRSMADDSISSFNNSDDSESSNRRSMFENAPKIVQPRRPTKRGPRAGSLYSDGVQKMAPHQSREIQNTKMPTARVYGVGDSNGKTSDYRRRRIGNKSAPGVKLSTTISTEISTNPRVHNRQLGENDSSGFMDINKVPSSIMMVKPQT